MKWRFHHIGDRDDDGGDRRSGGAQLLWVSLGLASYVPWPLTLIQYLPFETLKPHPPATHFLSRTVKKSFSMLFHDYKRKRIPRQEEKSAIFYFVSALPCEFISFHLNLDLYMYNSMYVSEYLINQLNYLFRRFNSDVCKWTVVLFI